MMFLLALLICGNCHVDIVQRFARTPMGSTSGPVDASSGPPGSFLQPSSRTRFEIARNGNSLRLNWDRQTQELQFFIGSGRMGRSYAFLDRGYLYQVPVGYYANRRAWDAPPGYEHDLSADLNRPITAECLYCHAGAAAVVPGTVNRIADPSAMRGVPCERCHGDATAHAAQPRADNIVNPSKLMGAARDSVCEQCHLAGAVRLALPAKKLEDFRPGQQLSDFLDVYVDAAAPRGVRVNGHADALAQSRCRRESGGKLWCGTCHDPHAAATPDYRAKCLNCHQAQQCPSPSAATGDCTTCHMPKDRAIDGGHTVFTNHSISRHPPPASTARSQALELRPYYDRKVPASIASRDLGLAYSQLGRFDAAWPLLRESAAAGQRDPALFTRIAALLAASGKRDRAIQAYRQSLDMDRAQIDALLGLAALVGRDEARDLRHKAAILCPRQANVLH